MPTLTPVSDVPLTTSAKYVLRAAGGQFYTGKAGKDWVSTDITQAFQYDNLNFARIRAIQHNAYSALHDLHFIVLALTD